MTHTLQAKQGNRRVSQAGWIIDHWVAFFLATVERAIRHRRAKDRGRTGAYRPAPRQAKIGIKPMG
jgi:hypothetical protein